MRHRSSALAAALVLIGTTSTPWVRVQAQTRQALLATPPLEHYLEALRQQAGIPGISAAVVQDGEVVWEKGFGFQNVESRIRATPDTPYFIGGLSQSFASVLLLQCVEQRRLSSTIRSVVSGSSCRKPARRFGRCSTTRRPVRLELSSSSRSIGTRNSTPVMEWCAPQPYRKSVAHRILDRLAMRGSVPGTDLKDPEAVCRKACWMRQRSIGTRACSNTSRCHTGLRGEDRSRCDRKH